MKNSILADNYISKHQIKTIPNRDIIVKVGAGIVDVEDENSSKPNSNLANFVVAVIIVSLIGSFFLIA